MIKNIALVLLCVGSVSCKQMSQQASVLSAENKNIKLSLSLPIGTKDCLEGPYAQPALQRAREFVASSKQYNYTCWSKVSKEIVSTNTIDYSQYDAQYSVPQNKTKYDFLMSTVLSLAFDKVKKSEKILISQEAINILMFAVEILDVTAEEMKEVGAEIYTAVSLESFPKPLRADFSPEKREQLATEWNDLVKIKQEMQTTASQNPAKNRKCYFAYGVNYQETKTRIGAEVTDAPLEYKALNREMANGEAPFYIAQCARSN